MNNSEGKPQSITFDGHTSEVIVRSKTGNKIVGQFSAIGPLTNKQRRRGAMQQDIFDLLDQVSKGAFSVFNNLKFNRSEENNLTRYAEEAEMSKTDKEVLSRRLRELKNAGIIRSVRKEIRIPQTEQIYRFQDPRKVFIINPDMIRCLHHHEAMYLWEQCAPKGKQHAER